MFFLGFIAGVVALSVFASWFGRNREKGTSLKETFSGSFQLNGETMGDIVHATVRYRPVVKS
jgi:hypothetical protein